MKTKLLIIWLVLLLLLSLLPISGARAQQDEPSKIKSDLGTPLSLSLEDAVLLALNRNQDLKVQVLNPQIAETAVDREKAVFDLTPSLSWKVGKTKEVRNLYDDYVNIYGRDAVDKTIDSGDTDLGKLLGDARDNNADIDKITQTSEGSIGFSKLFSSGTKLDLSVENKYSEREQTGNDSTYNYSTNGSLTINQPILKGMGKKVHLSLARQAEIDTKISAYELRQYVIEMVSKVQTTYWDLVLAEETLKIQEESLELSQRQMAETQEKIKVGKEAESELISAQAEVAAEKGSLIDAKSAISKTTLELLRLLNPDVDILWEQKVKLTTPPAPITEKIGNIQEHVATAIELRPDINQARLNLQKGNLEVVRTQNGLLPKLDFFFALKRMADGSKFPNSFSDFDSSDYSAGLNLSRPFENLEAKAQSRRASLNRRQYQESIENLKQKIQVDVRQAILEIERCREKITASKASRIMQEEKLKVEQEKFRVGRSTNLQVFQAQRDLTKAQVEEVTAVIGHIKAFIALQVAEGILLKQWSIEAFSPLLR